MGNSTRSEGEREAKATKIIEVDEERIRDHLDGVVRKTVEETLNGLLEAEADQLCKARRYERTDSRRDTSSAACVRYRKRAAVEQATTGAICRRKPAR